MKTKLFVVLLAFAGAAVVGVGAYRYGLDQGLQQEMKPVVAGAGTLPVTGSGSASVSA